MLDFEVLLDIKNIFKVENDRDFEAEDRLKSDSEVDSDFDDDEQEVEPEDAGEQELRAEKRQDRVSFFVLFVVY